jgi:hypothetical protein
MALSEHKVEIAVGRRATDGYVRVSIYARKLLALTMGGTSERAPTILLTVEQAQSLARALALLIPLAEKTDHQSQQSSDPEIWLGDDRRVRS